MDRDAGRRQEHRSATARRSGAGRAYRRSGAVRRALRPPSLARGLHLARRLRRPDRAERRLPRQADQRLQDPRLGHAEGDRPDHREVRRRRRAPRCASWSRAPTGQRLDSAAHAAAVHRMLAAGAASQKSLDEDPKDVVGDHEPARGRVDAAREQRPGRLLRRAVRPDRLRAAAVRHRLGRGSAALDRATRPASQVEFTGEAESAPPTQGLQRHHRPGRRVRHPDGAVPRARADRDPAALRDHRRARRVPAPLPRRAADALQHDHRDPRADDRARRRASTTRSSSSRASGSSCTTGCRRRRRPPPPARPRAAR